jgi:acetylornithine deacetylase/succinyl-diaminopimelate desuccinylase-like protein
MRNQRPIEILQRLIRFDTTNPPGNEAACIEYVRDLLVAAGVEPVIVAGDPARPNLLARLAGQGRAAPLLLYGHVDVVTTAGQTWRRPPFAGEIAEGCVWGRGALDMKGGVAMMLAAFLRASAERLPLPGDLILAVLSDEENGGDFGARFLVEQHAGLFHGARYALGEFGGFSLQIGPRRFYPIMVAEKQICWMRATVRGPAGHGSIPVRGGAMARLGALLRRLDRQRLPVHITLVARRFFETISAALPFPSGALVGQLLNPALADRALDLIGPRGAAFGAMLRNTVSPTIVRGGDKVNVIPGEVQLDLDGRVLPGYTPDDLLAELRPVAGRGVELAVLRHDTGPGEPDMGLFRTLGDILREADPQGIPVPMLGTGVTDARFFSRLGIQTYGFIPMTLPESLNFSTLIHAADERIPVEALDFGTEALVKAIQRFG